MKVIGQILECLRKGKILAFHQVIDRTLAGNPRTLETFKDLLAFTYLESFGCTTYWTFTFPASTMFL